MRWAGHILRSEESNLLRRVLFAEAKQELEAGRGTDGGLLMDAPTFSSVEELLESAEDRDREGWRLLISCLLPDKDKNRAFDISCPHDHESQHKDGYRTPLCTWDPSNSTVPTTLEYLAQLPLLTLGRPLSLTLSLPAQNERQTR